MHKKAFIAIAAIALALVGLGAHAEPTGTCAAGSVGGDWRAYGHDLSNTRTQPDEQAIGATQALGLTAAKVFNVASLGGGGNIDSTPTVANGCVFVATDGGNVFALNADTFELVWRADFAVAQTRLGGVITGAVTIDNGLAFVAVSDAGHPFVVALDEFTGAERWRARAIVDDRVGSFINASPVAFNGLVFMGFAGDEYSSAARGGYAIIDQTDGTVLQHRYTIDDDSFDAGYWGGSVWSTGAVDATKGYLYAGAGNPASHTKEHAHTNALLKIDVDRSRATFGDIVASYKGTVEQYYPGLDHQPVCDANPDITYGDAWSASCLQLDLDFGASPSLFSDSSGALTVGALQKSGIYHAVHASTMTGAWSTIVGTPCFICNAASPASDDGKVFAAASQPGQLAAVDGSTGAYAWVAPVADAVHYNAVSIANGIVYVTDLYGNLNAFDEATGVQVLKHSMGLDVGANVGGTQSSGVAIARHTLYVPAAGYLIAYR